MADRLKALRRIEKVQADMAKLAEWRIAVAEQRIAALAKDRAGLADYVTAEGGLGVPLAKAALRSMLAIDRRSAEAERIRAIEREKLGALRRRERVVAAAVGVAEREARAAADAAELAAIMEAWLAQRG